MRSASAALIVGLGAAPGLGCSVGSTVLARSDAGIAEVSVTPPIDASVRVVEFERLELTREFISEGVTVADLDEDGAVDVVTYPFWWAGPDFTERHEIGPPRATPLDPLAEFSSVYGVYAWDVDADGCLDAVVVPRESDPQMYWYRSPSAGGCAASSAHWEAFPIVAAGLDGAIENPIVVDLFEPGTPVLLMGEGAGQTLGWWAPGDDPTLPWELHPVSEPRFLGGTAWAHGIGAGDLNGDGLLDVLSPSAWFQQVDPETWIEHSFGEAPGENPAGACSRMWALDVDVDGAVDVVCGRPHDYGLYWWRHVPRGGPDPSFVPTRVSTLVSQMHALALADLDGDAVPEVVTGKRWYANLDPGDPGQGDAPVLVYYTIARGSEITFTPHVIDEDSGVGAQIAVADLDEDGDRDIVVSNKRGVVVFFNQRS